MSDSLDLEDVVDGSEATEKIEEAPVTRKRKVNQVEEENVDLKAKTLTFDQKKKLQKPSPNKNSQKLPMKKEEVSGLVRSLREIVSLFQIINFEL